MSDFEFDINGDFDDNDELIEKSDDDDDKSINSDDEKEKSDNENDPVKEDSDYDYDEDNDEEDEIGGGDEEDDILGDPENTGEEEIYDEIDDDFESMSDIPSDVDSEAESDFTESELPSDLEDTIETNVSFDDDSDTAKEKTISFEDDEVSKKSSVKKDKTPVKKTLKGKRRKKQAQLTSEDIIKHEQKLRKRKEKLIKNQEIDNHHIKINVIHPDKRKSSNMIQYPEMVLAIQARIKHIENGAEPLLLPDDKELLYNNKKTTARDIAEKEFYTRRSPFILVREVGRKGNNVYVEHWKVREMDFPKRLGIK